MMRVVMNLLAALAGIYMLLIFVRIMLTWFSSSQYGRPVEILGRITDPYLLWWSNHLRLRAGAMDLSPIVGMAVLSLAQSIFSAIGRSGFIRLGTILAIVLEALWSAAGFILIFFTVVLVLRLIAFLTNRNTYSTFWHIVDTVSQPILYRITRFFFKNRILHYRTGIIFSIAVLLIIYAAGNLAVRFAVIFLLKFPI
jgi:YggT family protein